MKNIFDEENEKVELNLENPIFVNYINVDGLPRQYAEEALRSAVKAFNIYSNVTIWTIASNESKIECVYPGKSNVSSEDFIKNFYTFASTINEFVKNNEFEKLKSFVRDFKVDGLLK